MSSKLDLLQKNYEQAVQNFNWADRNHIKKAIFYLDIAEFQLLQEIKKLNTERSNN